MNRMLENFMEDLIGLPSIHEQILSLLGEDAFGRDRVRMGFCSAFALHQADEMMENKLTHMLCSPSLVISHSALPLP